VAEAMVDASRWSARSLSKDASRPIQGSICATVWPTCSLHSSERWFDELYVWTEGFEASTMQRARIQAFVLKQAFQILDRNESERIAVTLSFGTVERCLDHFAAAFENNPEHSQRVVVMLRGSFERLRQRYRLRAFVEYLHILKIPVGYRLSASRVSMELKTLDFLRPDFAKVLAPKSARVEAWQDLLLEARVAEVPAERLIVAGVETPQQLELARQARIPFGQGSAVMAARAPRKYARVEGAVPAAAPPTQKSPDTPAVQDARPPAAADRPSWSDLARMWNVGEGGVANESSAEKD
jgi:hypothetical protein